MSSSGKKNKPESIIDNILNEIQINSSDLPLCCPMPNMITWNSHPRVYLDIKDAINGHLVCPYCSTKYILK